MGISKKMRIILILICLLFLCGCVSKAENAQMNSETDSVSGVHQNETIAAASEEPEQEELNTSMQSRSAAEDSKNPLDEAGQNLEDAESHPFVPGSGSVLLFASDYQHKDGWEDPPVTLNIVLDSVYTAGVKPDNIIFCGDYTSIHGKSNHNADPHDAIEEMRSICLAHDGELNPDDMIFEQGNHDMLTDDISASGLHEFRDYLVYVINTETDFPWGQGKKHREGIVIRGALKLKECLNELIEQGESRPIFLAGHVPLHFTGRTSYLQGTGDNLYAKHLFKVINEAGESLNLVYLYGHNHSRGYESYMGGSCVFRAPGDWLLIPEPEETEEEKEQKYTSSFTQETISFTYLNAGYVGYYSSAPPGSEEALTCTVCEISEDGLTFSRYAEDGLHSLSSEGTYNRKKDDRKLIPAQYYGSVLESPYTVELKRDHKQEKKAA